MAHFDEMRCDRATRSQLCRTRLIQSALESSATGTLNDGPDAEIRQLDTDLVTFENIKFAGDWMRLAPSGPILAFDSSFDVPSSGPSSAFLIRETHG